MMNDDCDEWLSIPTFFAENANRVSVARLKKIRSNLAYSRFRKKGNRQKVKKI
jgi:hypothetical protein